MQENLAKELQEVGLSDKEAKVYLAVLEMGQGAVQDISSAADVNRATTYVILEALKEKGLISTFEKDKKSLFVAETPRALENIIREQEEELNKKESDLESLMPQLHTIYNLHPNKPVVKFYEGKEGLRKMQKDFLSSNVSQAHMFFSLSDVGSVFTKDEHRETAKIRRKKKIRIFEIFTDSRDANKQQQGVTIQLDDLTYAIRVPEKQFPFSSDITIYGDKVMMASLKGDISGVIIQNSIICDTLRSIFNLAYEAAEEEKGV